MYYSTSLALALAGAVRAFPGMTMESMGAANEENVAKRSVPAGPAISSTESNCGPDGPCLTFNPTEQAVSITGAHAYMAPTSSDLRGPCPGLNAAANHAYLPRSGLAHVVDTITGLGEAYGMSADLAGFLAAYAVIFDGDLASLSWSIGGAPALSTVGSGVLGRPEGISYSHNKYEGDSSATRQDAYLNNGDAHSLIVDRFTEGYTYTQNGGYTLDSFRQLDMHWVDYSVSNNPYYFAPLFSTTLVSPAAYNFVINFMSNRSASNPSGFLSPENYKTFFAISGNYPNFKWNAGQEKIPANFYRRPSTDQYNAVNVFQDLIIGWAAYPSNFRFGGNTNGVNTYQGIDLTKATGGAFNSTSLFEGNNFQCYFYQTLQQFVPDELKGGLNDVTKSMSLLNQYAETAILAGAKCPAINPADPSSLYAAYPGHTYSPTDPSI